MAVRLKDIARDLGVSVVTVSKVLRGTSDISEETRKRVLKRMRELDYRPNVMARGLASGRTFMVGLVVPDLVHPFFAELAKSLSSVLRASDYVLVLASSEEDPEIEKREIQALLKRGIDALLIASCQLTLKGFYGVEDQRTPYILIDRNFPQLRANFVGTDDYRGGRLATEHLIDIGKRRIAHIGGPEFSSSTERLRGYKDALLQAKIELPDQYCVTRSIVEEQGDVTGYEEMQQLLKLNPRPDAVFCYNDLTAFGAMQASLEKGLAVPEDIAFVGFGNVRYSQYLRIPLTSIDQSTSILGENAARLALDLIQTKSSISKEISIEPKLIIRRSTVNM